MGQSKTDAVFRPSDYMQKVSMNFSYFYGPYNSHMFNFFAVATCES